MSSLFRRWLGIRCLGGAVYAATKHAVRAISEALRIEVKPDNICTTIISPGAVATKLPNSVTALNLADAFVRAVVYAMSQPDDVDSNEILFRPTRQEL